MISDMWTDILRVRHSHIKIDDEVLAVTDVGDYCGRVISIDDGYITMVRNESLNILTMPSDAYIYMRFPSQQFKQMIAIIAICI